jgi:hypothetical protein
VRTNLLLCMKDNQFVHAKSLTTSQEIWDQIKTCF